MDFAVFNPDARERMAINLLYHFWGTRGPFTKDELLGNPEVGKAAGARDLLESWLADDRETIVLGELVLHKGEGRWDCEAFAPGTPSYVAWRILPQARALFAPDQLLPIDDEKFISLVYHGRARVLAGQPIQTTELDLPAVDPELKAFVVDRLTRCRLEGFRPDVLSIAELCDIFDEYEFHGMSV